MAGGVPEKECLGFHQEVLKGGLSDTLTLTWSVGLKRADVGLVLAVEQNQLCSDGWMMGMLP